LHDPLKEEIMKKHSGLLIAIALSFCALLLGVASMAVWVKANPYTPEINLSAPTIVSYQGQIWDGDAPYNGIGHFKFAIMTAAGTITLWSNDGSIPPAASVPLPVNNGLFSVNLGDTSLPNMTQPLDGAVFENPDTHLRVWFSPDGSAWTQIPDQVIASVPYALQAQNADHAEIANYAPNAGNADELDGYHADAYQLRVTGTCPVGQAVSAVNADGSVACVTFSASPTHSISNLVISQSIGQGTAIAIGSDGLGVIAYFDTYTYPVVTPDLSVFHCSNVNCTDGVIHVIDSAVMFEDFVSIAIGMDGYPLIAYYDVINSDLKVAHCDDVECSSSTFRTLDPTGDVGLHLSLTIGGDGLGLMSYYNATNGNLKVAHCNDTACTNATITPLDQTDDIGMATSIVKGTDGFGLISYYDNTNKNLKVAHCVNALCTSADIATLDSTGDVGAMTSITIGADGLGLISYYDYTNGNLKAAHCSNIQCSSASTATLDTEGNVGQFISITKGVDGLGMISYQDQSSNDLKVAHCDNTLCSSATINTLDSNGNVGWSTSIAIGADRLPLIASIDLNNNLLKAAHCSNELCIPINWEYQP
jgi:hypothetical protein